MPAGKVAASKSTPLTSGEISPVTVETICITWLYFSIAINSATSTVPGKQTRPKSFRPKSTSIKCSARSLVSANNSMANCSSWASVSPRGLVPAIGCSRALPSVNFTNASGLEPTKSNATFELSGSPGAVISGILNKNM